MIDLKIAIINGIHPPLVEFQENQQLFMKPVGKRRYLLNVLQKESIEELFNSILFSLISPPMFALFETWYFCPAVFMNEILKFLRTILKMVEKIYL